MRRAALRPEAVRGRQENPPRRWAPAPASPPSAPPGLAPSGCPAASLPIGLRDVPAPAPRAAGTCLLAAQSRSSSRSRSTPYCSTSASVWASTPAAPWFRLTRFHASARTSLLADAVIQRMEAATRLPLGSSPESALELSHFVDGRAPAGVVGTGLAGHALALTSTSDVTTAGALPSGRVLLRGHHSVLRPPRTPAAQRSLSPSAYTSRFAVTTAAQTGLSCSALLLERVLRPIPRGDPARPSGSRARRRGLRRDMSGSALPLFLCRGCRLHFMLRPAFLLPLALP